MTIIADFAIIQSQARDKPGRKKRKEDIKDVQTSKARDCHRQGYSGAVGIRGLSGTASAARTGGREISAGMVRGSHEACKNAAESAVKNRIQGNPDGNNGEN